MEDEKRERSPLMTGSLGGRVKMKEVRFSWAQITNWNPFGCWKIISLIYRKKSIPLCVTSNVKATGQCCLKGHAWVTNKSEIEQAMSWLLSLVQSTTSTICLSKCPWARHWTKLFVMARTASCMAAQSMCRCTCIKMSICLLLLN